MDTKYSYETDAKNNKPMPEGLTWVEQCHYQAIAALTIRYRAGGISKEQAVEEKRRIDIGADRAMNNESFARRCTKLWVSIKQAAAEFENNPTIEGARKLYDVLYGNIKSEQLTQQNKEEI